MLFRRSVLDSKDLYAIEKHWVCRSRMLNSFQCIYLSHSHCVACHTQSTCCLFFVSLFEHFYALFTARILFSSQLTAWAFIALPKRCPEQEEHCDIHACSYVRYIHLMYMYLLLGAEFNAVGDGICDS